MRACAWFILHAALSGRRCGWALAGGVIDALISVDVAAGQRGAQTGPHRIFSRQQHVARSPTVHCRLSCRTLAVAHAGDRRRPWIAAEKDRFHALMALAGFEPGTSLYAHTYFEGQPASLRQHFDIISAMRTSC